MNTEKKRIATRSFIVLLFFATFFRLSHCLFYRSVKKKIPVIFDYESELFFVEVDEDKKKNEVFFQNKNSNMYLSIYHQTNFI